MAVQERELNFPKINFERLLKLAGKVKGVAKAVLSENNENNWTIIEEKDLTPEKLRDFISGRRR